MRIEKRRMRKVLIIKKKSVGMNFSNFFDFLIVLFAMLFHYLLDLHQPDPIKPVLLLIIGWLVGWLVGNAVFSETAPRIFLIFWMKLGDYKGRKVTEPDFWEKFLIWRYSPKRLQINPKSDTLVFFSKTALTTFLVFGLKLALNITFNLNETLFLESLLFGDIWPRNCQNLVVFLQFTCLVNLFLFWISKLQILHIPQVNPSSLSSLRPIWGPKRLSCPQSKPKLLYIMPRVWHCIKKAGERKFFIPVPVQIKLIVLNRSFSFSMFTWSNLHNSFPYNHETIMQSS